MVDLHVYLAPHQIWRPQYNNIDNDDITQSLSLGFIRIQPEARVYQLREELEIQLNSADLPQEYVFLKSVGRCLTKVKQHQEYQLKAKHFLPQLNSAKKYGNELYIMEASHRGGDSSASNSVPVSSENGRVSGGMYNEQNSFKRPKNGVPDYQLPALPKKLSPVGRPHQKLKHVAPNLFNTNSHSPSNSSPHSKSHSKSSSNSNSGDGGGGGGGGGGGHGHSYPHLPLLYPANADGGDDYDDDDYDYAAPRPQRRLRASHSPVPRRTLAAVSRHRPSPFRHSNHDNDDSNNGGDGGAASRMKDATKLEQQQQSYSSRRPKVPQRGAGDDVTAATTNNNNSNSNTKGGESGSSSSRRRRRRQAEEDEDEEKEEGEEGEEEKEREANSNNRGRRGSGGGGGEARGAGLVDEEERRALEVLEREREEQARWEELNTEEQNMEVGLRAGLEVKERERVVVVDEEEEEGEKEGRKRKGKVRGGEEEIERVGGAVARVSPRRDVHPATTTTTTTTTTTPRLDPSNPGNYCKKGPYVSEKLSEILESIREQRKSKERQREELVKRAKFLQTRLQHQRGHARDQWKKRYYEEKKKTGPQEEQCNKLRHELDVIHRKYMTSLEPAQEKPARIMAKKPSERNNVFIQATRLRHDTDDLQRRVDHAKMKLTAELKLRNQTEMEVRALKGELIQQKINLNLIRKQQHYTTATTTTTTGLYHTGAQDTVAALKQPLLQTAK
ncbi:putative uncharacterized protein DDB_G0271606 [Argonauta hians]